MWLGNFSLKVRTTSTHIFFRLCESKGDRANPQTGSNSEYRFKGST